MEEKTKHKLKFILIATVIYFIITSILHKIIAFGWAVGIYLVIILPTLFAFYPIIMKYNWKK